MSNRLRRASFRPQEKKAPSSKGTCYGQSEPAGELPKPKLVWVLGVLFSILLLATAVAAFSMWRILRHR